MRTHFYFDHYLCPVIKGEEPMPRQNISSKPTGKSPYAWLVLIMAVLFLASFPVASEDSGHEGGGGGHEGGGGGGGCGDVFGDLIHVLRLDPTGQPIFAQRWIELPKEEPGYGWGYCPIAVDELGGRIPFLPYSCDYDPGFADYITEVDYFGRLNGGRTKERNQRMHFNEVISNIKQAKQLRLDPTGRLEMGFEDPAVTPNNDVSPSNTCVTGGNPELCIWSTVDSPMESMALYVRLMKYGHLATDPMEVDTWAHGDPALGTQYNPALGEEDWAKFRQARLWNLLPAPKGSCWLGVAKRFNPRCATPKSLDKADFANAAAYLGAAANKTGKITVDLVQYLNRFLKIARDTAATYATKNTLPALYEDCYSYGDPWVEGEEPPEGYNMTTDLEYLSPTFCKTSEAAEGIPGWDVYAEFTNVKEMFVDFSRSGYTRKDRVDVEADLILEGNVSGNWVLESADHPMQWVALYPNLDDPSKEDAINNFVGAASDSLRAIEYIHNYAVPADLFCKYNEADCL